jgi:hypothetical protein
VSTNSASATWSREPEQRGGDVGIERQRRTGQRARAERRHIDPLEGIVDALDVTTERPTVGEQVVSEQHRLGALQVRVAGKIGVTRLDGPRHQHVHEIDDSGRDIRQRAT